MACELVVLDGPVEASGYDWYLVDVTSEPPEDVSYPFGWVAAAGKDGEAWIAPERHDCPKRPTEVESLRQDGYNRSSASAVRTSPSRLVPVCPRSSAAPKRRGALIPSGSTLA